MPLAVVRIRWSDLAIEALEAVTDLVTAVDAANPADVPDDVLRGAERVREALLGAAT